MNRLVHLPGGDAVESWDDDPDFGGRPPAPSSRVSSRHPSRDLDFDPAAGVRRPRRVASVALLAGALKRLEPGSRTSVEDWTDDADFADSADEFDGGTARPRSRVLPLYSDYDDEDDDAEIETLRAIARKPSKADVMSLFLPQSSTAAAAASASLENARRLFAADAASNTKTLGQEFEDFEADFEFSDGQDELALPEDVEIKTPARLGRAVATDDWDEPVGQRLSSVQSSLPSSRSGRSSALSLLSPSSTAMTEDPEEGFDDLVLPDGPLDLPSMFERRKTETVAAPVALTRSPEQPSRRPGRADDLLDGLDINHDVFADADTSTTKNTWNKNIVVDRRSASGRGPSSVAALFTPKPTRIPRPVAAGEGSGLSPTPAPAAQPSLRELFQQSSRTMGLGISGVRPAAAVAAPTASRERTMARKSSMVSMRPSGEQRSLLPKKSMPSLRTAADSSLGFGGRGAAPPPLPPLPTALASGGRPLRKMASYAALSGTRHRSDSPPPELPELPAKTTEFLTAKSRAVSRGSTATTGLARKQSTTFGDRVSPKGTGTRVASEALRREAANTKTITKPIKRRLFGDGTELDMLDDLPVNTAKESKFLVSPSGTKSALKPPRTAAAPLPPPKAEPKRADKARPSQIPARKPSMTFVAHTDKSATYQTLKAKRKVQQRPHLIKPLGGPADKPKTEKGMRYNPKTFKWEGNEPDAAVFNELGATPPRPALISNVTATKGVQVVGGMVFDPVRMCWLKVGHEDTASESQDEDDPFAGFEDLVDDVKNVNIGTPSTRSGLESSSSFSSFTKNNNPPSFGEFVVGEEFDIGVGFIRRQTVEEERWKRKIHGWGSVVVAGADTKDYLYEIRRWVLRQER
ncbi:uncharacterized protein V1510DRAFT_119529 [Dipodascopsis tothii]|uniref:uncharacterized protein n=1 Tax=Dipodascopsis tothii TaxID=44089 RepID=UPI0034CDAD48